MPRIPRVELSSQWWEEVRPPSVKDRELERALERLEEAEKVHERRPSADTLEELLERLEEVEESAEEAQDELERSEDEIEDALDKLRALAVKRRQSLERERQEPDEPEVAELFDLEKLRERMRLLAERPMTFAFGIGHDGGAHLVLDRVRRGLALMNELEKESGFQQSTFGRASAQGRTLHLEVHGPRIPNLEREVRDYLRANTELPFRQVRVRPASPADEEAQPAVDGTPDAAGSQGPERDDLLEASSAPAPGESTAEASADPPRSLAATAREGAALARQASQALTREARSIADRVRESVDRLARLEQDLLSRSEEKEAFLVRKKRELIERAYEEGARRVRLLRQAADRLVEAKTGDTRRSIERTIRTVTERLARARRIAEEGLEWLKSR